MAMADEKSNRKSGGQLNKMAVPDKHDPWAIESMPPGLDESPLDFLFADHHRQRQVVQILLRIADGEYDESAVRNLIVFLKYDLPLHIFDEEQDLLPLLREQCRPEDEIDALIARLTAEHADDDAAAWSVVGILERRVKGKKLREEDRDVLRAFAEHLRRHLAVENGVLLPIARVRMSTDSLNLLAKRMKARRAGGTS